jgi:hypothetical protein
MLSMGEFESSSAGHALLPSSSSRDLVVVEHAEGKSAHPRAAAADRLSFSRFHFAAAAALAIVVAVAGALLLEDRQRPTRSLSRPARTPLWLARSSR